ncbi:hypothetical protein BC830DRAFT_961212 [Chytriomyces sp. MP71]|nr:hypothetical protein BC830DRAFT_961212 [Chytriomyces sp. MP71]
MNSTSNSSAELQRVLDQQSNQISIVAWVVLGVSILQIALLAVLIVKERRNHTFKSRQRKVATPVNLYLLSMIVCNTLGSSLFNQYWKGTAAETEIITYILSYIFSACLKVMIMHFSWNRGWFVIETVSTLAAKTFRVVLWIFPVTQICEIALYSCYVFLNVADWRPYLTSANSFAVLNAIQLVLFDLGSILCYMLYLRQVRLHAQLDSQRLIIVANYGIVTAVWTLIWIVSSLSDLVNWDFNDIVQEEEDSAFILLYYLVPSVYIFTQLCMKYALYGQKMADSHQKKTAVASAKGNTAPSVTRPSVTTGRYT